MVRMISKCVFESKLEVRMIDGKRLSNTGASQSSSCFFRKICPAGASARPSQTALE
jgi:hypothetical protein